MLSQEELQSAKVQAELELKEEQFKQAVSEWKEKIRNKRSFLSRLIPFKILIVRRTK